MIRGRGSLNCDPANMNEFLSLPSLFRPVTSICIGCDRLSGQGDRRGLDGPWDTDIITSPSRDCRMTSMLSLCTQQAIKTIAMATGCIPEERQDATGVAN